MTLIVIGEQIIGSNRIFGGDLWTGRFEPDKGRVRDEGAKRAVEAAGGAVAFLVFWLVVLLVLRLVGLLFLRAGGFPGLPVTALARGPGTGILLCDRA